MTASLHGYVDVVRTLIESKAQVNLQDEVCLLLPLENMLHNTFLYSATILTLCLCPQNGFTALHMAAQEGKVDVVRLLIDAEAHIDMQINVYHV